MTSVNGVGTSVRLRLEGVCHRYPSLGHDTPAPVTFSLKPGDHALLMGRNGSGKTTLLRRVVGLLSGPGSIEVDGTLVNGRSLASVRRKIGFLWQSPDDALLLPTVADDVLLGPLNDGLSPAEARDISAYWLERLGIVHLSGRRVRDLSCGEKQLVSLAGVLARRPGLLLLDEPTSFLDVEGRGRLRAIVEELPATVLLVSHHPRAWLDNSVSWFVVADLTS